MTNVEALAAHLRNIVDTLPEAEARRGLDRLRKAQSALTVAMRESHRPEVIADLGRACESLETAIRQFAAASTAIDDYLLAIGVGGSSTTAIPLPSGDGAGPVTASEPEPNWWRRRVCELTDDTSGADEKPGSVGITELFTRLVDAARRDDRSTYRRLLLTAPPDVAVRLPGLALPMIRNLASDRHGGTPSQQDAARLQSTLHTRSRRLLPKLPDHVSVDQVNAACGIAGRRTARVGDTAAVDFAAIGPILVAVLHAIPSDPKGRSA